MLNKIRMTWISWVQVAAILCSLPITILLVMDGVATAMADHKFSLAVEMVGIGNYNGAVDRVEGTLEWLDNYLPALEMRAKIQLENNEYAQAGQTYNQILQVDPNNAGAKLGLAAITIRENLKKFTDWRETLAKDPAAAAQKREELDRIVERARSQVKDAINTFRNSGGNKYADGQVYLGLTFLMDDREKNPTALEMARKEFEKALPAANPQPAEIPSRDAAMQLANGLGYVAYLESLDLWAKVDQLKKAFPQAANRMMAPTRLDNSELQVAATLAAQKSYEAVTQFLAATGYGKFWRDGFVNFEMAMCEYLPREELASTEVGIEKFLFLGEAYLIHKETLFGFWQKILGDEQTILNRLEITAENTTTFARRSYPFALAMAAGCVIAGRPLDGQTHLNEAAAIWGALLPGDPARTAHLLLVRLYVNGNIVDRTPTLEWRTLLSIFSQMRGDAETLADNFGEAQGAPDEAKAWAWTMLSLAQFRHHTEGKRAEPLSQETIDYMDGDHALKWVPPGHPSRPWVLAIGHEIAHTVLLNSKDEPSLAKARDYLAKYPN